MRILVAVYKAVLSLSNSAAGFLKDICPPAVGHLKTPGKSICPGNLADLYSLPLDASRQAKKQSRFFNRE
jgi:hypothetical protein